MPSVGPQLPAHLTKRKRSPEDDSASTSPPSKTARSGRVDESSSSDDDYGPSAPGPRPASPKASKPSMGPTMPAVRNTDEIDLSGSDSDTGPAPPRRIGATMLPSTRSAPKRTPPKPSRGPIGPAMPTPRNANEVDLSSDSDSGPAPPPAKRTIGPAMPPAPLSERPPDDSDSEDDYGPALPSAAVQRQSAMGPSAPTAAPEPEPSKRDDWMLAPPTQSNYHERDPTKMKNRTFRSNPAPANQSGVPSIWTETATEKLARLQNSVLGREDDSTTSTSKPRASARDKEENARRQKQVDEYNAQTRGQKSLYEERKESRRTAGVKPGEGEDDPSKRAFNWEKDMAVGGRLGGKDKKDMVNKAAELGGRFAKGSYL